MQKIRPMLCEPKDAAFNDPNYLWEIKLDGARIIAVVGEGGVRLFARSGIEKTGLYPDVKIETSVNAILDGEMVAGSNFNDLQHRANRQNGITEAAKQYPARFVAFDILEARDIDLQSQPLMVRKEILQSVLLPNDRVMLSTYTDQGVELYAKMVELGLEGVVGKHKMSRYLQNKREWLKVKCWQEDNFLVVGYTAGTGWRATTFGALVLSDMKGNYVGGVGTGFRDEMINQLYRDFVPGTCPFPKAPEPATWVKPFAVKIRYLEKTNDGILRFPSFKGVV